MRMYFFEDENVNDMNPLTLTRPAFELRCGATTLRERQQRWFDTRADAALVSAKRAKLCQLVCPELLLPDSATPLSGPLILVNARWLPPANIAAKFPERGVYLSGNEVAYAVLTQTDQCSASSNDIYSRFNLDLPRQVAVGTLIHFPWELVEHNAAVLEQDAAHWKATRESAPVPAGVTVIGPPERLHLDPSARVEPQVVIDTTSGPVMIDRDALVRSFSRIDGPSYIGPRTHLLTARAKGVSFGPECRLGGEIEATIVQGYSNKAHDGFLGHSYVGEWINLGAGTITSDLRTDYGPIHMTIAGQKVNTSSIKVGTFLGDHAKTSIGTLFNTGSLIGPFSLLLTSGTLLPRTIPAFCRCDYGRLRERSDQMPMFEAAATMMKRRRREWTEAHTDVYRDLFEQTAKERRQTIDEEEQRQMRRKAGE